MVKDVSLSHMLTKAAVINNTNNSNTVYIFLLLSMLRKQLCLMFFWKQWYFLGLFNAYKSQ